MRGMSKAAKAEAYDRKARECELNELALADVLNDRVTWGKWVSDGFGKVRCGVSRTMGAMGGILITTYRADGQGDMVNVELLESGDRRIQDGRRHSESFQPLVESLADALRKANTEVAA